MSDIYVTETDEEGFNTCIIGPFNSYKESNKFIQKQMETYEGHVRQPYQDFTITSPTEFSYNGSLPDEEELKA